MSHLLVDLSRSLLQLVGDPTSASVPSNYNDVRPHHLLFGYTVLKIISNWKIYQKLSENILSKLSNFAELCIPLIHLGVIPDFVIRFGIRIQLYDHLNILRAEDVELELKQKILRQHAIICCC